MTATPTPEKKPAIAWHRVNEKHERQYQKKQEQLVSNCVHYEVSQCGDVNCEC